MWRGRVLLVAVLCSAVGYTRGQGLTVTIDVDYSAAPPDFVGGPNDYRAASTLLLTCQVTGGSGTVTYLWTSTCTGCFINSGTFQNQVVGRTVLHSVDSGTLTCMATRGELTGTSDTVEVNVVGAGIFVNTGDGSVPTGVLPNNGIVIAQSSGTIIFQCRSGSLDTGVGQLVDLDGNTFNIGQNNGVLSVGSIGNPAQAGSIIIRTMTGLTAADNGVYSCRIPDESGAMVDVNIGVYRNGFSTPPTVSSLTYDPDTRTLTCTSTDSPATTVTWTRGGGTLTVDGTTYSMTQTVTVRGSSTYENVLTLPATGDFSGMYGCQVGNALGDSTTMSVEVVRPAESVMLNGAMIPNHGIVTRDNIGTDIAATLQCLTTYDGCCDDSNGFWFYPSGSAVMDSGDSSSDVFYRSKGSGAVYLHHRDGTGGDEDDGIFRCQIPDVDGNSQDLFVGIYSSGTGIPVISEDPVFTLISEDPVEFNLTCTSTGGPATTVTWTPMGNDVTQLQNAVSATYTHTLTVTGRFPGVYTCSVNNDRGTATRSIMVQAADPPTGLTAVQESDTTVRVSWTPPTSGDTPTGYRIDYQEYNGQPTSVDVGAGETDRVLTGLSSDVAYSVSIVALAHFPSTVVGPVISRRQGVSVVLKGAVFPNNGLVTRDDIGNDGGGGGSVEDTLQCLTDDFACCMTASDSFWFFPSGNEVVGRSVDPIVDFYRTRGVVGTGGIYLHRRSDAGGVDDDGIYRCHIPGLEGSRTVYIGIYGSNTGNPVISEDPVFTLTSEDPVEFKLTCTSTGGPATTVTWAPMGNDDTSVTQLQNAVSATYTHTLTVPGRVPGVYTCSVNNDRGTATRSIMVQVAAPATDFVFSQVNATTIRVSWTAPTSGAPPTGYRVFYQIDSEGEVIENVDDTEWLRGGFVSDRTFGITVSVLTLSDYLPSVIADAFPPEAGSVEPEVKTSPTSIEVTWVELPVSSNGIITLYEIQYGPTNALSNITIIIRDGPPFRLTNLSPEMSFTFYVTPFTLLDRGDTSEITADTVPPQVQNVRVTSINSTSVIVSWSSVSLLPSDVDDYNVSYKVYYSRVQSRKRQGPEEQSVTTTGTFIVIIRLTPGAQYRFEVTTLAEGNGEIIEGPRSQIDDDSMPVLPPGGGGEDNGCTDFSGSIVGAIVGTFVITVLLYTVILVAVIGVVVVVKRRKMTYALRTGQQQQETTGIPMKECLAYGDVSTGERSGEEAHIYEYADAGMRVQTEQRGGGGEGIYDN